MLTISENIFAFICGIGIFQGFLLAGLIGFHRKGDCSINKFLALFIATMSIVMMGPLILKIIPWHNGYVVAPFPVLLGPLMFFYVRSFRRKITWKEAIPHLMPFVILFIVSWFWLNYIHNRHPYETGFPREAFRSPSGMAIFILRYIHLLAYYFITRNELKKHQRSVRQYYSETSRIDLDWAKLLINGYLLLTIIAILFFGYITSYPEHFYISYLVNISVAAPYIYLITYKGIIQSAIWGKTTLAKEVQLDEVRADSRNAASLTETAPQQVEVNTEVVQAITNLMEREKLYQETELTLQDIAERIGIPSYQVSQVINSHMGKNFYELVNGYRVEEAKRLLRHPDNSNYTILSIGFEAGFNSKTTFNTVFKKFTGKTPTEYRSVTNDRVLTVLA